MRVVISIAAAFGLSACSALPAVTVGANAADPDGPAPKVRYVSVLSGTVAHDPVEPRPWRSSNEVVAPKGSTP
jgi:hypothetical protein